MGLFYLFLILVWISDIFGIVITFEVYLHGHESNRSDNIPYDFSIFIAAIVGLVAIFSFFPIGMLVYSHTKNFFSGQTTSEKFSKSGYKFREKKKNCVHNFFEMCCNRGESEGSQEAMIKYNKDLEVTLKDYS